MSIVPESAARLDTGWTRALNNGDMPDAAAIRDHLQSVHTTNAGFTEACASACTDSEGRDSYDWLAETVGTYMSGKPDHIVDLACGSGVLLERLAKRHPDANLTGIDMSEGELALARQRLGGKRATLHKATAQDLNVLADNSVDAVLCHWALTLMKPLVPVLREIERIAGPRGVFSAIVDGPIESAPGYAAINTLIFDHVGGAYPQYGTIDMGDPRVRDGDALRNLLEAQYPNAKVAIEPNIVSMTGTPAHLAKEAASFFYSVFVLNEPERAALLTDLTELFAAQGPAAAFHMPINRVAVRF